MKDILRGGQLRLGLVMLMLLLTSAACSSANQGPGHDGTPRGGGFEQDDVNNDGKVSQDEFSGPEDLFTKLDANGDGFITKGEINKRGGGQNGPPPPPKF